MSSIRIPCLIWPAHYAVLNDDSGKISFYMDSPRAGGRYEFNLPHFNVGWPDFGSEKYLDTTAGAHATRVKSREELYYADILHSMRDVLQRYRPQKPRVAGVFNVLLSREIYASKESPYELTNSVLERIASQARESAPGEILPVENRAGYLARHLAGRNPVPYAKYHWQEYHVEYAETIMAATCSLDFGDLIKAAEWLEKEGFIKLRKHEQRISMKPQPSLLSAYAAPKSAGAKDECFVAMSFAKEEKLEALYRAMQLGAGRAGYRAVRVDRIEHINKIDDEIIARIREAKFVIADLTGQNCGVYYEAGFADGLERKIIYTCEQHDINNVHFDINHNNILLWEREQLEGGGEFARRLQLRIESNFDKGNYEPEKPEE